MPRLSTKSSKYSKRVLERYIASCDRMIALVGDAYGFELEETEGHAEQPRCSYTQWEYFFAMGERLDGSRQTPKEIFLYFASPEFLAMQAVSQPGGAAQLQQEFIKELHRSGKDWNRFGLLDELRALVLRDGFRLQTRPPQSRNLPYTTLGRLFKGREHILSTLHEQLQQNSGVPSPFTDRLGCCCSASLFHVTLQARCWRLLEESTHEPSSPL